MTESLDSPQKTEVDRGQSLADMVSATETQSFGQSFSPEACVKVGIMALLVALLHSWQFPLLYQQWRNDPNWSHGFLIPLFSLYLLYTRWHELAIAPRRTCWLGLPIIILSVFWMIFAFYPISNTWLRNLSMIPLMLGLVLFLAGPRVLKLTWLPIAYLALAMPVSDIVYQRIAFPLQNLAATCTGFILTVFGVEIDVASSQLTVVSISGETYPLTVAEACSGVRSLMAFVALGVAMAYIDDRPVWQRLILVVSVLPITVMCNIIRVASTCSMYVIDKPELGQDVMHKFMGMALLIPALLMLLGLSRLLKNVVVEDDEEEDLPVEEATS